MKWKVFKRPSNRRQCVQPVRMSIQQTSNIRSLTKQTNKACMRKMLTGFGWYKDITRIFYIWTWHYNYALSQKFFFVSDIYPNICRWNMMFGNLFQGNSGRRDSKGGANECKHGCEPVSVKSE